MIAGLPARRESPAPWSDPPPRVAFPPQRMAMVRGGRPLKRWRWVGLFFDAVLVCAGEVYVGPARQRFWAVWDREHGCLREHTALAGDGGVELAPGVVRVRAPGVELHARLDEGYGVETVCRHGRGYVWTRKQGGLAAEGSLRLDGGTPRALHGRAVIDDTAGYHGRATEWWWTAGVGETATGVPVAWNLVSGVNDPPRHSERTVWLDGHAHEVTPVHFASDLSRVEFDDGSGELHLHAEGERRRRDNLLLVRSDYRQPFGRFSGSLPVAGELRAALGVSEHHRARW